MATDVRNDINYWYATAQRRHDDPLYAVAMSNIARIQREQAQAQHAAQFQANLQQRAAEGAAREKQHSQEFTLRRGDQQQKQQALEDYRRSGQEERRTEAAGKRNLDVLNLAQSPALMTSFGKQAPAIQKALIEQFYAQTQGGGAALGGPGGAATLAALGGGTAGSPETAAVRNYRQSKGLPVAPQTAPSPTDAPAGVPQRGNVAGVPQQNAQMGGGSIADQGGGGGGGAYPPGTYETPGYTDPGGAYHAGIPMIGGSAAIPSDRLIQHGQIYNGPAGYDLNVNTGEWVPSSLVGTINGRPATDVIAEGALKSGVSPEDTRSREVYNTMRNNANRRYGEEGTTPAAPLVGAQPEGGGGAAETAAAPAAGGESQRGAVSRFFAPPGSGIAHLFGMDEGVSPLVQKTTAQAPAPAPAPATNRPFFGSPELADQTGGGVQSGRGEFKADYGQQANTGGKLLDFPSTPPSYVNPSALPSGQGPQAGATPPANVLPNFNSDQQAALAAQRAAEEEARRRAAEAAAARESRNI